MTADCLRIIGSSFAVAYRIHDVFICESSFSPSLMRSEGALHTGKHVMHMPAEAASSVQHFLDHEGFEQSVTKLER
jgi:hypothetical protein